MIQELVRKSRSYRGYNEDRQIKKEELLELAECARLCPSSVNKQPLCYYLAWEKEEVNRLQGETNWARGLPQIHLPHEGMCPTAFIVILQDAAIDNNLARYQKDVGIVAQTMLLAAAEKGLGGCMIGNFNANSVRKTLGLADTLSPMLIVALGEPRETVIIREIEKGESTDYYRDKNDVHYVPKRKLEDIVLTADRHTALS